MTSHENVACPKCEKPLKFKNFKRHLIACHSLPNDEAQLLVNEAKQSMPARGGETASCSFCGHEMWRRNVAKHMLICKANTSVKTAASTSMTQGGDEADSRGVPDVNTEASGGGGGGGGGLGLEPGLTSLRGDIGTALDAPHCAC